MLSALFDPKRMMVTFFQQYLTRQKPKIHESYPEGLRDVGVRDPAIRHRVSRLSYSRRCAEASAVKAHLMRGISRAPGMEIGHVVKDAGRWDVEAERWASEFDAGYYRKLLEKAWEEAGFVFGLQNSGK